MAPAHPAQTAPGVKRRKKYVSLPPLATKAKVIKQTYQTNNGYEVAIIHNSNYGLIFTIAGTVQPNQVTFY